LTKRIYPKELLYDKKSYLATQIGGGGFYVVLAAVAEMSDAVGSVCWVTPYADIYPSYVDSLPFAKRIMFYDYDGFFKHEFTKARPKNRFIIFDEAWRLSISNLPKDFETRVLECENSVSFVNEISRKPFDWKPFELCDQALAFRPRPLDGVEACKLYEWDVAAFPMDSNSIFLLESSGSVDAIFGSVAKNRLSSLGRLAVRVQKEDGSERISDICVVS